MIHDTLPEPLHFGRTGLLCMYKGYVNLNYVAHDRNKDKRLTSESLLFPGEYFLWMGVTMAERFGVLVELLVLLLSCICPTPFEEMGGVDWFGIK